MNLKKYDNKLVRITDKFNDVFEGIAYYFDKECNEAMYGFKEECLKITCTIFNKPIIKKVEEIKEFSNKYGKLEESVIEDGISFIEEVLDCEEDEHIYRLLMCIKDNSSSIKEKDQLKKLLNSLVKYNEDKRIIELAKELMEEI